MKPCLEVINTFRHNVPCSFYFVRPHIFYQSFFNRVFILICHFVSVQQLSHICNTYTKDKNIRYRIKRDQGTQTQEVKGRNWTLYPPYAGIHLSDSFAEFSTILGASVLQSCTWLRNLEASTLLRNWQACTWLHNLEACTWLQISIRTGNAEGQTGYLQLVFTFCYVMGCNQLHFNESKGLKLKFNAIILSLVKWL